MREYSDGSVCSAASKAHENEITKGCFQEKKLL